MGNKIIPILILFFTQISTGNMANYEESIYNIRYKSGITMEASPTLTMDYYGLSISVTFNDAKPLLQIIIFNEIMILHTKLAVEAMLPRRSR